MSFKTNWLNQRGMGLKSSILSFCFLLLVFLSGCTPLGNLTERFKLAEDLAQSSNFQSLIIPTNDFNLKAFARCSPSSKEAFIYLEGDGFSWVTRSQPSSDPTPRDPIALRLAQEDPRSCVIYLARPCQYLLSTTPKHCTQEMWTSSRYNEKVINAMNQALSFLKTHYGFKKIHLHGYSGGGVVAALISTKRKDILSLTTFAANMDIDFWSALHEIEPLHHSLNPIHFTDILKQLPQVHYIGEKDEVVPESVILSYEKVLGADSSSRHVVIPHLAHEGDWPKFWKEEVKKSSLNKF